jgi:coenzyme F420-reducing hydrogenase beta subunit
MKKTKNNISKNKRKNLCCGCENCSNVCPVNAINMKQDSEGFQYPMVDNNKCIDCGNCYKICPMINNNEKIIGKLSKPISYAVKNKNNEIRYKSRSGGVFTALSNLILKQNGVVYGCILNNNFEAVHIRADNYVDRDKMRGSKYVQSRMEDIQKKIGLDLKNGKTVLFTGTSCQVKGIRNSIPHNLQDKLFCVDIVCHGVPSPKIWKEYLEFQRKKYGKVIDGVDFRNKKIYGWREHVESIFIDGKRYDSKIYTNLFYNHVIIRPSCFNCPFKSIYHPGDITIADCWGIENAIPDFDDDKGVSLVLINNYKGKKFFGEVDKNLIYKKIELEKCMQPPLKGNFILPNFRKDFWNIYYEKGLAEAIKKYSKIRNVTMIDRIKNKLLKLFRLKRK